MPPLFSPSPERGRRTHKRPRQRLLAVRVSGAQGLGRGSVEELLYLLANLLALEEHYSELGMLEGLDAARSLRVALVDKLFTVLGMDEHRGEWCVLKHLLLVMIHAHEALGMLGSQHELSGILRDIMDAALRASMKLVEEWSGGKA